MRVVIGMTGLARARCLLEFLCFMAIGAGDRFVFSKQREGVEVMIEPHFFLPGVLVVAARAIFPLRALMRIVALVTVDAAFAGQRFRYGLDMARLALCLFVGAAQWEFRF